ncbi:hypothetical protein [Conchiformibius steedae]|uniref:hypothetical protein n=1 Tax=Conchiformibius steedae TaxID=153493 RepID=UPI0026EB0E06|nr:hypothetical protein [Conchiformibius steedae]
MTPYRPALALLPESPPEQHYHHKQTKIHTQQRNLAQEQSASIYLPKIDLTR